MEILEVWIDRESFSTARKMARVVCECGEEFVAYEHCVRTGRRKRCANHKKYEGKHTHAGGGKSPTYLSWRSMKQRCNNPNHNRWHRYGGRGIRLWDAWHDFVEFLKDMGERPGAEYSLDRIDNDGDYEPDNCRWVLKKENIRYATRKS
jgi:hypothetical protein